MDKTPKAERWPKDASVHLQVAASCKAKGAKACDIHGIDLSESSQVRKFADDVLAKHKTVDVLVNNAGMGTSSGSGPIKGELTVTWVLFIYDGLLMTQMAWLYRLTKCVAAQCVSVDKPFHTAPLAGFLSLLGFTQPSSACNNASCHLSAVLL